jgi:hypothetical protein
MADPRHMDLRKDTTHRKLLPPVIEHRHARQQCVSVRLEWGLTLRETRRFRHESDVVVASANRHKV